MEKCGLVNNITLYIFYFCVGRFYYIAIVLLFFRYYRSYEDKLTFFLLTHIHFFFGGWGGGNKVLLINFYLEKNFCTTSFFCKNHFWHKFFFNFVFSRLKKIWLAKLSIKICFWRKASLFSQLICKTFAFSKLLRSERTYFCIKGKDRR